MNNPELNLHVTLIKKVMKSDKNPQVAIMAKVSTHISSRSMWSPSLFLFRGINLDSQHPKHWVVL